MILARSEIIKAVERGKIVITPYDESRCGTNSYDVCLDGVLKVYYEEELDCKGVNKCVGMAIPEEGFVLEPGELYLGSTVEYTESGPFVPMIEGRSSLGRLGVFVHATAGFGDIGFKGKWTLEITVARPVRIYKGMRVAQLFWHVPYGNAVNPYNGKYQGQQGPVESMLWRDEVNGQGA